MTRTLLHRLAPARLHALEQIWAVLPEARLVGGVVRDLMVGRAIADVDLAVPQPPEEVMQGLKAQGITVVPTGLAHGTVTAVIDSAPYEITTLRRDVETDGRHAVVCWTDNWQEDAARRDFTINAMSCDSTGAVHDYFGGQQDLAEGTVRFVGDATLRIQEDALRILRFFRFWGRYGQGRADAQAMQAITAQAALLNGLSVERVWSELKRILAGPKAQDVVYLMQQAGILPVLLPEGANVPLFARLMAFNPPADALLRLAALVPNKSADMARRLKFSRAEAAHLKAMQAEPVPLPKMSDAQLRHLLADTPPDILAARSWLYQARYSDVLGEELRQRLAQLEIPVFPIAGRDLLEAGCQPGPHVGQVLKDVRNWWQQGGCSADKQACLAYALELVKALP
ncbi:CCA tRNA nucleotidyltransferase [Acetobacter oryzifermentans]|uniref:CCA tRNA nucleotidyltransferase n=1 Tax=Acetobacter oryzifermentans TaxID=1633874 RepID=UPI0039BFC795